MNINRSWIFSVILCLISYWGASQHNEIGLYIGGANYIGEIGNTQYIQPKDLAYGFIFKRNLTQRIGLRVYFGKGKYSRDDYGSKEPDRINRGLSFGSSYTELGLGLEVNYVKLPVGNFNTTWSPYIHVGVNRLVYENIYFNLYENIAKSDGKSMNIGVPFGVGVKFNLGQYWVIAGEVRPQVTFSDNLDGSNPKKKPEAKQFSTSLSTDWLVFTGISITYAFGRLPCCRD